MLWKNVKYKQRFSYRALCSYLELLGEKGFSKIRKFTCPILQGTYIEQA